MSLKFSYLEGSVARAIKGGMRLNGGKTPFLSTASRICKLTYLISSNMVGFSELFPDCKAAPKTYSLFSCSPNLLEQHKTRIVTRLLVIAQIVSMICCYGGPLIYWAPEHPSEISWKNWRLLDSKQGQPRKLIVSFRLRSLIGSPQIKNLSTSDGFAFDIGCTS